MFILIVGLIFIGLTNGKTLSSVNTTNLTPLSNEIVDYVNSLNTTWKAGTNFDDLQYIKKLNGTLKEPENLFNSTINETITITNEKINLPEHFDAREVWPNCDSIATIRDQGGCAACWAVNTVSIMSDRLCIKSNGTINVQLSAEEVLTCCHNCSNGCVNGGFAHKAFSYWIDHGIVTGGSYQGGGCLPYTIYPCTRQGDGPITCKQSNLIRLSTCRNECASGYNKNYTDDKYFGKNSYNLVGPKSIMLDIMTNGPVAARMKLYNDLYSYKSGIYQQTVNEDDGYHTVKLIGWGNDQGVDYWLAANSWGTYWGDKGFFKIKRGENECEIENEGIAGLPRI
ncbi:cathepsin B-like [Panonychus citri]|uniref:cathepsin B-like n=1 Tax=Panonychus citri TaxID=50023 RepID=UPI002307B1AC|nr:cathepsin B-like [Panonychus citri]